MLGLDVSQATLDYSLVDPHSRALLTQGHVPNTPAGIASLLQRFPAEHPWVLEPTGSYSQATLMLAQQAGRTVLQAEPRQAQAFLRAINPRAKTDRLDSLGLAHYAQAIAIRPFPVKSEVVVQLEQHLAARKSRSASRATLEQQRLALPAAAASLAAGIATLDEQLAVLDRLIADDLRRPEFALAKALQTVPGIGAVTAAAVTACLTTRPFADPDAFVAYIGLDIRVRESGQRHGVGALSKRGNPELRRLFYLCALTNLRSRDPQNPFKLQYAREVAKGLSTTGALNAVARKLARTCWSLAKYGTTDDAGRVHRQPTRTREPFTLDTQP